MSMITVSALTQAYPTLLPKQGLRGKLERLFGKKQKPVERKTALRTLSCSIERGEIYGVLGLDGAGKTTLLRLLAGELPPEDGELSVLGFSPYREQARYGRLVGMVPNEIATLPPGTAPIESCIARKTAFHMDEQTYQTRLAMLSAILDVEQAMHSPAGRLTDWTRLKCQCVLALLAEPRLVLLDEPCHGLEPAQRAALLEFLRQMHETEPKTTFVLAARYLEDMEELAERVLVLDRGKRVYEDSCEKLCRLVGDKRIVELTLGSPNRLYGIPGAKLLKQKSELELVLEVDVSKTPLPVFLEKLSGRLQIQDIRVHPMPMTRIIDKLQGKS